MEDFSVAGCHFFSPENASENCLKCKMSISQPGLMSRAATGARHQVIGLITLTSWTLSEIYRFPPPINAGCLSSGSSVLPPHEAQSIFCTSCSKCFLGISRISVVCRRVSPPNRQPEPKKSSDHINSTQPLKQYEHISSFIYSPFQMLTFCRYNFRSGWHLFSLK